MDPDANRSKGRSREADVYWQRRFFSLVAALGVIGLLAWALSGASGGKPASQAAGASQAARTPPASRSVPAEQATGGQTAAGAAGTAGTPPAAPASASASAAPSPSQPPSPPAPSAGATARPETAAGKGHPGEPAAAGAACAAADTVLTLSAGKDSYAQHERPTFQIDVVSTAPSACRFDASPRSLRVVVTHGGQLAWNSGACLHDAASRVIQLQRGVPVVVPVTWDRRLTVSGCPTTVMAATGRTYMAAAQSGGVESAGQSFRLR